jgi:hypothetical protein
MTLPSRLPGLSRKVTDLAWAPRLSPNPVGQALSEAHPQETRRVETVNRRCPALPLPSVRPEREAIHARGEQHM